MGRLIRTNTGTFSGNGLSRRNAAAAALLELLREIDRCTRLKEGRCLKFCKSFSTEAFWCGPQRADNEFRLTISASISGFRRRRSPTSAPLPSPLNGTRYTFNLTRSATGQLLGQRKAEALRLGWVGCFEFGIREDTEAADLLLRPVPILLDLHDSLDSTIVRRPKGRHTDDHARGLARHALVSHRRRRGSDHGRAGDRRNRWTILRRNGTLRH